MIFMSALIGQVTRVPAGQVKTADAEVPPGNSTTSPLPKGQIILPVQIPEGLAGRRFSRGDLVNLVTTAKELQTRARLDAEVNALISARTQTDGLNKPEGMSADVLLASALEMTRDAMGVEPAFLAQALANMAKQLLEEEVARSRRTEFYIKHGVRPFKSVIVNDVLARLNEIAARAQQSVHLHADDSNPCPDKISYCDSQITTKPSRCGFLWLRRGEISVKHTVTLFEMNFSSYLHQWDGKGKITIELRNYLSLPVVEELLNWIDEKYHDVRGEIEIIRNYSENFSKISP